MAELYPREGERPEREKIDRRPSISLCFEIDDNRDDVLPILFYLINW